MPRPDRPLVTVMVRLWDGVPRAIRWTVGAQAAVLTYGAVVHVIQVVGEAARPYPWAPAWLAVYFVSLTLVDPLAAGLLLARRAAGLYLSVAVFVTDALANAYAVYVLRTGTFVAAVAQALITLLALATVVTAARVRRWLLPRPGAPR